MRHDLLYGKKSVHVKLSKEDHALLREKLFRYSLTMQDLFQEAAMMALSDGERSDKLLQKIAKKKLKAMLEKPTKRNAISLGEFDSETLYNLLESDDNARVREAEEE